MFARTIFARAPVRRIPTLSSRNFTKTNLTPICGAIPSTLRLFSAESKKDEMVRYISRAPGKVVDEAENHSVKIVVNAQQNGPLDPAKFSTLPKVIRDNTLLGKVAIVTGGGRGLGFSMAQGLCQAGIKALSIFDANNDLCHDATTQLKNDYDLEVMFCHMDVRNEKQVIKDVNASIDLNGVPDVLINAAGIAPSNIKAESYDVDEFRRVLDVNLWGTFIINKVVGNVMIDRGMGGSIINIASMSGSIVNYPQEQSAYNASKAGVIQLTKSLATEWAKHGIRVNSISPGYMDTALNRVGALEAQKKVWCAMTPQGRLGGQDELNGLAVYLAGDGSKFMTGSNVVIDGGYSCW